MELLKFVVARGGLNENGPQRLKYLDIWSAVGRTVWKQLVCIALLEEACPRGRGTGL